MVPCTMPVKTCRRISTCKVFLLVQLLFTSRAFEVKSAQKASDSAGEATPIPSWRHLASLLMGTNPVLAFTPIAVPKKLPRVVARSNAEVFARPGLVQMESRVEVVTEIERFQEVIKGPDLVVVDFSKKLCGPCKLMAPKFDKMSEDYTGAKFYKAMGDDVNIQMQAIMLVQGVKILPSFGIYKDGEKIAMVSGPKEKEVRAAIEDALKQHA